MAYQSLYRRYRPQKFSEIRGQEHVVKALRNAVRDDRVGHAYLLSGPRGTGKTTAARILAKVLNCENPVDGEPDGICMSCQSIESGTSFDLHELDAASNNKVDDIRDLLSKVALGTPGRSKVYLLDEVHMLSSGAENALLKTLEEPPDHVVFVLATTEPHKVVSTIRSRTQHLELTLIPADQMTDLVHEIAADAGLTVDEEAVRHVVKMGGGSARDTLSALDQVVAAGGVTDVDTSTPDLLEALASRNSGPALQAVETATGRGTDPRRIGERFIDALRSVFLVKMGSPPARLSEPERELSAQFVDRLSPATITRSLEVVGKALVDMRQAPDPRIDLEVAFVRICEPAADSSAPALLARIEALEAAIAGGAPPAAPMAPVASSASDVDTAPEPAPPAPAESVPTIAETPEPAPTVAAAPEAEADPASAPTRRPGGRPADMARAALKPRAGEAAPAATPAPAPLESNIAVSPVEEHTASAPPPPSMRPVGPRPETPTQPAPADVSAESQAEAPSDSSTVSDPSSSVTVQTVQEGWTSMLDHQSTKARARFLAGTVSAIDNNVVMVVLPTEAQVKRCEPFTNEVESALAETFGVPLTISLAVGDSTAEHASTPDAKMSHDVPQHEADVDIHDLTDADVGNNSVVDRITDAFPGAELIDKPE